jgi:hypothetical protein
MKGRSQVRRERDRPCAKGREVEAEAVSTRGPVLEARPEAVGRSSQRSNPEPPSKLKKFFANAPTKIGSVENEDFYPIAAEARQKAILLNFSRIDP